MRILKKMIKLFCFLILFSVIGTFLYVKFSPKILINSANNIILYDQKEEIFFKGSERSEWIELDKISQNVIDSTIYTEDKHFYKHFGFDFLRIGKALLTNLKNKSMNQGASTITQQYAKNLFLDFDKTWKRKWDEMWYTLRIEANYSKDEILEGYLNTINYGHGKYGIESASQFYFGKSASELDLAEASLLIGIPKAPSYYSPITHLDHAKERQQYVLKTLVKNEIITQEEMDDAYEKKLEIIGENTDKTLSSIHYYQDAVMNELEKIPSIPHNYSALNGLKIYTTFDFEAQNTLEESIRNAFPEDSSLEVASVVMNPKTGGVMALVGGRDYNESSYNRAIFSKRQVGSTMKPFLYYAALENGFTSSSSFISEETSFSMENGEIYSPINYNKKYGNKPISMATAIAYSENIYAIKTHTFLGYDALINVAKRVGIPEELESVASLPLGTNEINILNMASGYSSFANLGYKVEPHFITKIVSGNGDVLYEKSYLEEMVLNPSLVYILNNMLTATYDPMYIDYNYPTAISLSSKLKHKYALKSGTTSSDNWNIGFNPNILCAVWVGHDQNKPLTTSDYKYSQNIWYQTVESLEKDIKEEDGWYEKPKNVVGVLVEPISGKPNSREPTKNKKLMYFLKGTEPKETDPTFDEIEKKDFE